MEPARVGAVAGRPRSVSDDTVFDAVARVIGAAGPTGLTFAALARECGLSAPALAQRFGSKHALLVAFAQRGAGTVPSVFEAARRRETAPLEALFRALAGLTRGQRTRAEVANHLALLQMDLVDPELRVHAVAHARAVQAELRTLLDEAVAAGALRRQDRLETGALARSCWVAYNGALVTWAVDGTGAASAAVRRAVEQVLAPHRR